MEPDSVVLVVVLVIVTGAALYLAARDGRWWWKATGAAVAFVLAVGVGAVAVNDYYGYYTSWGQLADDFGGGNATFASQVTDRGASHLGQGAIESVMLRGAASGIDRQGLVYLPPQYFQAQYAHTRFPVVELIHGTPGSPSQYPIQLQLAALSHHLLADRLAGPMIYVMPDISDGHRFEECVDAPGAKDDTYVTTDVRNDVLAHFRAATDPAEWGIAGFSSGGYCAANLALRHPASFGAAGLMDAYYRPQDGPAAAALHRDHAAEMANDPLALAAALTARSAPVPAFWISAGTGVAEDIGGARAFIKALHGIEQVTFDREPGAGHNFYAWRASLPPLLAWMWTQLSPPALRHRFPVAGDAHEVTLPVTQPESVDTSHARHARLSVTPSRSTASLRPAQPSRSTASPRPAQPSRSTASPHSAQPSPHPSASTASKGPRP